MNKTLLLGLLFISNLAFGQEKVLLNSKHISIDRDQAIIVRTSQTPEKVKIVMDIPMDHTVCTQYGTQYVYGQDPYCGYVHSTRLVCRDVCVQTSPPGSGTCVRRARQCQNEAYTYMRSCHYPVTVCVQRGVVTTEAGDQVTIEFDLPKLADGETEEFQLIADQKYRDGSNVIFNLRQLTGTARDIKNIRVLGLDKIVVK